MQKQKTGLKEILSAAVFTVLIGAIFALNLIMPSPDVLEAERRIPAKFPDLSLSSISSGSFMGRFEDYAADSFIFRDAFRSINSHLVFDIYMQRDMSGLYRSRSIGLGEFRRTDAHAFRQSAQRIHTAAQIFSGMDMNIYYSLIPDKSIYAENYMPGFDLGLAESILSDVLGEYPYIRIADKIKASDFYKTDLHWDQAKIADVANHILTSMNAEYGPAALSINTAGEFYGLYKGQLALPINPDILSYTDIPGVDTSYLNEKTLEFEPGPVYDFERLNGIDPYDTFLRGPQPIVVLENEAMPRRELYLFRDSFGSSLAPLLAGSYSKVTLIDLRYINLLLLDMFIDFTPGSDILFIYGSQILNNPSIIQVSG